MQHHAYYVEGPLSQFATLQGELRPLWASAFERFGIEDARELVALSSLKNFDEAVFLIGASSITSEAQQALLKLFEEPQQGTVFYVLVPHGTLLPTLRSRMLKYDPRQSGPDFSQSLAATFLKSTHKARSDQVAKLLKDDEGARERVRELLMGLEIELQKHIKDPKARVGLEDIAKVRSYVGDRAPALKMLLEHLALSLPQV